MCKSGRSDQPAVSYHSGSTRYVNIRSTLRALVAAPRSHPNVRFLLTFTDVRFDVPGPLRHLHGRAASTRLQQEPLGILQEVLQAGIQRS